jgi:hypothetical protein
MTSIQDNLTTTIVEMSATRAPVDPGVIGGAVGGAIALPLIILSTIYCLLRKRRRDRDDKINDPEDSSNTPMQTNYGAFSPQMQAPYDDIADVRQ